MEKEKLVDIFGYINFRLYLADYYSARKARDKGFTHMYICFRLGQKNAKSYFNNVIKGRSPVTATFVDRFITVLELDPEEGMYFRALVNYNQTTSPSEKEYFFDQIVRLNRTPHKIVDKKTFEYYKEWYHSAVRAVLDLMDFTDNYNALALKLYPPITAKQARQSIELLQQLGLIAKNENGFWKASDKVLTSGDIVKDAVLKQFQIKCLDHAKNILANDTVTDAKNITLTVSISKKAHERITTRINQFRSEIRSIVHKDEYPPTRVYNLNLNLYPMSSEESK